MKNDTEDIFKYATIAIKIYCRIYNAEVFGGKGTVGYVESEIIPKNFNKDFMNSISDKILDDNKKELSEKLKVELKDISFITKNEYDRCSNCLRTESKSIVQ